MTSTSYRREMINMQANEKLFGRLDLAGKSRIAPDFLSDRINWIFSRFRPETGNSKYRNNPVNPVCIEY